MSSSVTRPTGIPNRLWEHMIATGRRHACRACGRVRARLEARAEGAVGALLRARHVLVGERLVYAQRHVNQLRVDLVDVVHRCALSQVFTVLTAAGRKALSSLA